MRKKNFSNFLIILTVICAIGICTSSCGDVEIIFKENSVQIPENYYPLEVHFIDVGQADSIFVSLPDDKCMLIDAGNNKDGEDVVSYIRKEGFDTIDYLIGTHPHADHIGGMDDVIENFNIGKIYMPKAYTNSRTYEEVLEQIKNKNYKINTAQKGAIIFENDDIKAEILSPEDKEYEEINNYSIVVKMTFGETVYLFTGDAEAEIEEKIAGEFDVDCDVLKVGHHGSKTSSTKGFISEASPEYAVICVGEDNEYGHPAEKVINLLKKTGAEIYRTDTDGDVIFLSDGKNIDVITRK